MFARRSPHAAPASSFAAPASPSNTLAPGGKTQLRVAHVAPSLGVGGLERMLVDFARRCDPARFDQRIIAIGANGPIGAELAALGRPVDALEKPPGFRPSTIFALARLLRREKVDVVHTHNAAGLFYGAPAARLAGVRRVLHTRHGVEPISRKGMIALRGAALLVDRIVCVSRDNAALAAKEGFPVSKLVTLLNGVDVERFCDNGPSPHPKALVVARLSPEKDVATLVRAVALLRSRGVAVDLSVVGDGPCRADLEALVRQLGLSGDVLFLGQRQDVRCHLAQAAVFVLPSLTEGISLTLLEAMASGLPVVAAAVGGNVEVVADEETGFLVPPGDATAMADAIAHILGDPIAARAMGALGRARAVSHFNLDRTISAYEAQYAA